MGGVSVAHEYPEGDIPLLALLPLTHKLVMSALAESRFRESGFTKTQLLIFSALSLRESLTMSQIASFISSSKEQATRAVAPLADAGYVERFTLPENRTKIHVRLTAAGKEFLQDCQAQFRKNLRLRLDETLTEEEAASLQTSIRTAICILEKVV